MYGRNANREDAARDHPLRGAILALLAKNEGEMSLSQIQAGISHDRALSAIAYHVRVLGETDLVVETDGYYKLS